MELETPFHELLRQIATTTTIFTSFLTSFFLQIDIQFATSAHNSLAL